MKRLPLRSFLVVRWLALVTCMVANLVLNHQWVATWRVAMPKQAENGAVIRQTLTVRERVELAAVVADAPVVAPAAVAWLPLDPLGAWRAALGKAVLHEGLAYTLALRPVALLALPAFTRLLGAAVSPQAP